MCDISTVFGILSSVVGFITDSQEADNQAAFNAEQERVNRINAERNARNQTDTENLRQQENTAKDSQEIQQVRREALQAKATARVAAGEAGVAGISVEALQRDFAGQEARFISDTETNAQFERSQSQNRIEGFKTGAQNRINASIKAPVKRPSFFGAALRIGGLASTSFATSSSTGTFRRGSNSVGAAGSIRNGPIPSVSF